MPATNFSDMPTLASAPPPSSHSPPFHRRRKSWARRLEHCCCTTLAYFPLAFVYSLTSWAVYIEVWVSFLGMYGSLAYLKAFVGIALYLLGNISYTIAVFTSPGSPVDRTRRNANGALGRTKDGGYQGLPTYEDEVEDVPEEGDVHVAGISPDWITKSVTAKSTGKPRYCKKCRSVKPDRAHHCSTCGKCVLKMDHHCPWLATCVGFKNYKPFLLFLIYISLFCWVCFMVAARWAWAELVEANTVDQGLLVVNAIVLSVLGGVIGLVLSGFTAWHIYLAYSGQTTIESLEKTRYLAPLRRSLQPMSGAGRHYLAQEDGSFPQSSSDEDQPLNERLKQIHANALPGVLRPEEGDTTLRTPETASMTSTTSTSPAQASLHRSYASMEAQRERDRYNAYLDEQDSDKMPNAFDIGWRRNVQHILGPVPAYWFLPICNTTGDGWVWDVSPAWTEARERVSREREQTDRANAPGGTAPSFEPPRRPPGWRWTPGAGFVDRHVPLPVTGPPQREPAPAHGSPDLQMQPLALDRRKDSIGSEEGLAGITVVDEDHGGDDRYVNHGATAQWNDIPDEFLSPGKGPGNRSSSRARRKGD